MMPVLDIYPRAVAFTCKLFAKREQSPMRDEALYKMIGEAQRDIAMCRNNYEFADSDTLIDMYIYAAKAHELRYTHLLRIAKEYTHNT